MSPDGENKDLLAFSDAQGTSLPIIEKPTKKTFTRSTVRELAPEIWIKPKMVENRSAERHPEPVEGSPVATEIKNPKLETLPPSPETRNSKPETPLSENLKISVGENSGSNSTAPWIIL